jgi:hypothetical protein
LEGGEAKRQNTVGRLCFIKNQTIDTRMKRLRNQMGLAWLLVTPGVLEAQYHIDWFRIGGGGTQATGAVYAVSGTIGQNGIQIASGGPFTLVSGFWALIGTVPTPGAPRLFIERVGDSVRIFWAGGGKDFVLQEADTLDNYPAVQWKDVSYPYTTNGGWISITMPLPKTSSGFVAVDDGQILIPAKRVVKFRRK